MIEYPLEDRDLKKVLQVLKKDLISFTPPKIRIINPADLQIKAEIIQNYPIENANSISFLIIFLVPTALLSVMFFSIYVYRFVNIKLHRSSGGEEVEKMRESGRSEGVSGR